MAAPTTSQPVMEHPAYIPSEKRLPEFTWPAVVMGALLGIIFGASSLYLVLKVGMTVSASIPVAVLSITLFRSFTRLFGIRQATVLENNIVQTAGSAGESIAFGVGVTMPALMLIGFDMTISRVMVVSVLGGLLGILMMIPLRRAFIVKLHGKPGEPGKLIYPEGTACAQVLISGEKGGASGQTVFIGFGLAFAHKFISEGLSIVHSSVSVPLTFFNRAAAIAGELASELLGVGFVIGLRTSSIMMAGGVLGYLVIIPLIAIFGDSFEGIIPPGQKRIGDMSPKDIRNNYLLFIGAGCVAAAGIMSMARTIPLILGSLRTGLGSLRGLQIKSDPNGKGAGGIRRTDDDLSLRVVLWGTASLVVLLALFLMTEVNWVAALLGGLLMVLFGFLFVMVSSRLTGEIGSSSNPISGMTVATLSLTCLIFLALGMVSPIDRVLALSIGAVVCIAASNGGTTSQDLKTGFLVGATPRLQQWAILIGTLTSALVIGVTLFVFNAAGTVYSQRQDNWPNARGQLTQLTATEIREGEKFHVWPFQPASSPKAQASGGYLLDAQGHVRFLLPERLAQLHELQTYEGQSYHVWWAQEPDFPEGRPRKYLVDKDGQLRYFVDPAITGSLNQQDNQEPVKLKFDAPSTQVMALIINGVLKQRLNGGLVIIGALIAITMELCGISALAFAVGVYVPLQVSVPIFLGGLCRWAIDAYQHRRSTNANVAVRGTGDEADSAARAETEITDIARTESSPGVLLSSGYIAGGTLAGVLIAFLEFAPTIKRHFDSLGKSAEAAESSVYPWLPDGLAVAAFAVLILVLLLVGAGWLFRPSDQAGKTAG